ncbi:zinc-dependent metalloprotease [Nocardioides sp. AE5]|uniref:zinc-dependent metalloprotease n=1 Tax=Nocardioides sp. AE5 TaxID=2962573 RepID=UPI002881C7E9|nr:zinc-dependent metalloprotease [Nocardioides sp. AE5]MDT0200591.1 zinc-dependent metalloprotease [Nocardioides sp. AE5]
MTDAPSMIDWELAIRLGSRFAGDGPQVPAAAADEAVRELRAGAERSTALVRDFTGLVAAEHTAPVLVVDRAGWIRANADSFEKILDPIVTKLAEKKGAPSGIGKAVGSRVTGAELGFVLGFMGSKVLGQFDPFYGLNGAERGTSERPRGRAGAGSDGAGPGTSEHGRLLLVAPNVVQVEQELEVDPGDFRLWVCLHEETHRVQFTAVPWMREHLYAQMTSLADSIEVGKTLEEGLKRVAGSLRGDGPSLLDLMSTPEQREIIDRVTGVMSLLEGHADVVMDGVGPTVIPSVARIRRRFNQRRKGVGTLDRLLRRVLGLDAKMAQYRDGAAFVRHVVDKVGMEDFNAVWATAENLPSKAEIHDPDSWVARVHA